MKDEARARLSIISKRVTPEEIDTAMGMNCDEASKIGDKGVIGEKDGKKIYSTKPKEYNEWILYSKVNKSSAIEDHLDNLITQLASNVEQLKRLFEDCDMEIVCYVSLNSCNALTISLSKKIIERIYVLDVDLSFDLFLGGV